MNFEVKNALKKVLKRIVFFDLPAHKGILYFYRLMYVAGVFLFESGMLIRKIFLISPMFRSVCKRVGNNLRIESMPYIRGKGIIIIGDKVYISGLISIGFAGELNPLFSVGNNSFIGHGSSFTLRQGISIGNDCLIAGNVCIQDNDGHPIDAESRARGECVAPENVKPVVIGNNVWIGRGALILKGVSIGDNAIVGAGAVVTKSILANEIVAGNPARKLN